MSGPLFIRDTLNKTIENQEDKERVFKQILFFIFIFYIDLVLCTD